MDKFIVGQEYVCKSKDFSNWKIGRKYTYLGLSKRLVSYIHLDEYQSAQAYCFTAENTSTLSGLFFDDIVYAYVDGFSSPSTFELVFEINPEIITSHMPTWF